MSFSRLAVQRPTMIIMIFIGVLLLGAIALWRLPVELYQNSGSGIISILTRIRGGIPPTEVETLVTRPIEEAVGTVSFLKSMYSTSREAESRVTLQFEAGTDMNFAALDVREKFAKVKDKLPKEIEKPVIAKYDEEEAPVMIVALNSDTIKPEVMRDIADEKLKPVISRISGVANVRIYGGREKKILVELDQNKMRAYSISIKRVMEVLGANNFNVLAGGVSTSEMKYNVRALGEFNSVEEIGNIGVATTPHGSIIQLNEIATIENSYLEAQDYARLDMSQNIFVYIKKESLANTIDVTSRLSKEFKAFHEALPLRIRTAMKYKVINNSGIFIKKAIDDVTSSLLLGGVLAMIIIWLFLNDFRATSIIGISIPLSVLATFIAMDFLNISINVMTLSGLTLAIGILVDSSIVVLENISKRRDEGLAPRAAIINGAEEVWLALLASTVTTIAVFLPIIFIDKEIRLVYEGLSFTVTASLIASLIVALTIVPTLSSLLAKERKMKRSLIPMTWITKQYKKLLVWTFRDRFVVFLGIGILFLVSTTNLLRMSFDIPTTLKENEFAVNILPPPGASLNTNDEAVGMIEELLNSFSEVESISTTVRKDEPKLFVTLMDKAMREKTKKEIMDEIRKVGTERTQEIHKDFAVIVDEGTGVDANKMLVINIFGYDDDVLEKLANVVANKLGTVPGLGNILMTDLRRRPEYSLVINKGRAALFGLTVQEISEIIHNQVRGMRPTKYHYQGREIETIARLREADRKTLDDIMKLLLPTQRGESISLDQVASLVPTYGPTTIDRKDKYRYVFVKARIFKGGLEEQALEAEKLLNDIEFPKDYFWRFAGKYVQLIKGKTQMTYAIVITIILIYMILASLFQSYHQPFIILMTVPLATIGVWLGLTFSRQPLSQSVLLGILMLAGIVVNNAIILIDHTNYLRVHGMGKTKAVISAATSRLRPILMTTLSTVLGFAPLAFGWSESQELWKPLAVTVIGGLSSSTILTLFIVPNIYIIFDNALQFIRESIFGVNLESVAVEAES
ncbi:MAG: efflux RND transporter permease subunit [Candidatus Omnitrophica bacterium]|nr:efflux RND transporter permease subunit [Candidatus Omnitrophota bacterium]